MHQSSCAYFVPRQDLNISRNKHRSTSLDVCKRWVIKAMLMGYRGRKVGTHDWP